jgi:hypothetical protein
MSPASRCMHPPGSLLKVTGKGKVQSFKTRNFETAANRTHFGRIYLIRYEVRNLIMNLSHKIIGHPVQLPAGFKKLLLIINGFTKLIYK